MAATNPVTQPRKQKITTFLWFDNNAEEAAKFYVSVFKNSRILDTSYYTEVGPGPKGSVMTISFELDGQQFTALNGGPQFKFTEAISLVVNCESQEEVDYYSDKLTADGGQQIDCGWVKDKYGLSWQITPVALTTAITDPDRAAAKRAFDVMMQMKKIDIAAIEAAYRG